MKFLLQLLLLICMLILTTQCRQESLARQINPNGDSELAILMRKMYDDAHQMKKDIKAGKIPVPQLKELERMLHLEATEPEKQSSEEYKAFALSFIQSIEAMKGKSPEERTKLYDAVIISCKNCHEAMCPGPLVKIEKLVLHKL